MPKLLFMSILLVPMGLPLLAARRERARANLLSMLALLFAFNAGYVLFLRYYWVPFQAPQWMPLP